MPIRSLTKEFQQKAENELNEVPSRVEEDLKSIREWLSKQPHINARMDDQWLLCFLRSCKFSLQRTKEKLDLFYTLRKLAPELFADRDPFMPEIQEALEKGAFLVLPDTTDKTGPRIVLGRGNRGDPEKLPAATVIKVLLMISEILYMEDDNSSVSGHYVIISLLDTSLKYATQLTPSLAKKAFVCLQDVYPTRIKGIYFTEAPSFFTAVYNAIKMFLKEKNRNRIKFYNKDNLENMYKDIPLSILPKDCGGEGPSCDELAAEWKLKVESYRDWFLEDVQYCIDESKRPGKPRTTENIFGIEGSFRKLEID